MIIPLANEVMRIKQRNSELFQENVLHILNGQQMYDALYGKPIFGAADVVPFNEAMCVNEVTFPIFNHTFNQTRAAGHGVRVQAYVDKVITPLQPLLSKSYKSIVLWFGEDVFCQMNMLTLLAYLEQIHFTGNVYVHHFNENDYLVQEEHVTLGTYSTAYKQALLDKRMPTISLLPIMVEAIKRYLDMQNDENEVTNYIQNRPDVPEKQLVNELLHLFSTLGYGDTQYLQFIRKVRN